MSGDDEWCVVAGTASIVNTGSTEIRPGQWRVSCPDRHLVSPEELAYPVELRRYTAGITQVNAINEIRARVPEIPVFLPTSEETLSAADIPVLVRVASGVDVRFRRIEIPERPSDGTDTPPLLRRSESLPSPRERELAVSLARADAIIRGNEETYVEISRVLDARRKKRTPTSSPLSSRPSTPDKSE